MPNGRVNLVSEEQPSKVLWPMRCGLDTSTDPDICTFIHLCMYRYQHVSYAPLRRALAQGYDDGEHLLELIAEPEAFQELVRQTGMKLGHAHRLQSMLGRATKN